MKRYALASNLKLYNSEDSSTYSYSYSDAEGDEEGVVVGIAVGSSEAGPFTPVIPRNVPLPYESNIWLSTTHSQAHFQILAFSSEEANLTEVPQKIGEIVLPVEGAADNDPALLRLSSACDATGVLNMSIYIGDAIEAAKNITINV